MAILTGETFSKEVFLQKGLAFLLNALLLEIGIGNSIV